jgi:hypothetical protein
MLFNSTLTVTGTVTFLSTAFTVTLSFTETNGSFSLAFIGTQAANTSIGLTSLVAEVLPAATNAPALNLSGLQITFGTSPVTYSLTGTTSWQITLGTQQSTIQVTLSIFQSGRHPFRIARDRYVDFQRHLQTSEWRPNSLRSLVDDLPGDNRGTARLDERGERTRPHCTIKSSHQSLHSWPHVGTVVD